jgi:hypothetical protein
MINELLCGISLTPKLLKNAENNDELREEI